MNEVGPLWFRPQSPSPSGFSLSQSLSLAPPESVLSDGNGRRAKDARSLLVDNSILRPPLSLASCFIIRAVRRPRPAAREVKAVFLPGSPIPRV